jgi:hypothetical protein
MKGFPREALEAEIALKFLARANPPIQTRYPIIFLIIIDKNNCTVSSPSTKAHHLVELDFKRSYDWRNSLTRSANALNHSFRWMYNLAGNGQRNMQVSDGTQFPPQAMHLPNRISEFADLLCRVIIREDGENQLQIRAAWFWRFEK